uniref:Uncharacterized protein n=1 Tax=Aegilops tauschii subsp. strangulata TaxID=200361 RepID=A0A453PIW2_AEGTS
LYPDRSARLGRSPPLLIRCLAGRPCSPAEGGDPVDAGPGGAGRGAGRRGGQEVAAGGPRARRDRLRAHPRAALRRQAGLPRPLQALARGGRRRARHRRLPQASGASCKRIPLRWSGGEHIVGTL